MTFNQGPASSWAILCVFYQGPAQRPAAERQENYGIPAFRLNFWQQVGGEGRGEGCGGRVWVESLALVLFRMGQFGFRAAFSDTRGINVGPTVLLEMAGRLA